MDLLAEMTVSPAPEEEIRQFFEHYVAAHEDIAVILFHPFLKLGLAEEVGQEVGHKIGEEMSVS